MLTPHESSEVVGRCRTVLVFGDGDDPVAVLTTVSAAQIQAECPRIHVAGPVILSQRTLCHLQDTVLGVLDRVLEHFGLATDGAYEVSFANVGIAGGNDVGLEIDGFSADASVLLATLSATLDLPLRQDVVCTAHVASKDGDLAVVASLPAKIQAAVTDTSVRAFLYADPRQENSLTLLAPEELSAIDQAVAWASHSLRAVPVRKAADLIEHCFSPFHVVSAGLRGGYFRRAGTRDDTGNGAKRTAGLLAVGSEGTFWDALERELLAGNASRGEDLLGTWTAYHTRRQQYPSHFGRRLIQLLHSLPPGSARRELRFPLVPLRQCLALAGLAEECDLEDVPQLMRAISERPRWSSTVRLRVDGVPPVEGGDQADAILKAVLDEISPSAIAERVTGPIDAARLSYSTEMPNITSHEDFTDAVCAYYLHLLRHTQHVCEPAEPADVAGETYELLDHTFKGEKSYEQAYARAKHGTDGGLLSVLDAMTELFRYEAVDKHVRRVFMEAMDPSDLQTRVRVMKTFVAYLGPHLPRELTDQPPERYVAGYERIVRTYVDSIEKVNALLRSM